MAETVFSEREVTFDPIAAALAAMSAGQPVVVLDDEDRENEGDLVFAAELATPALLHFTVRHTSGFVCTALPGSELDRLGLPPMTPVNQDPRGTAYAVTVDAKDGVTTGISARDRARTIQALADPATGPADLTRPGHVVPLRAVGGGVLERAGHTEAAVDLARLAGLRPAGALCELVDDDGTMMRAPECRRFADERGLVMISIADLAAYRRRTEVQVERAADTRLPTAFGTFRVVGYRSGQDEHVALVSGDLGDGEDVLVRVHSECLTGDVFGSRRCDCGTQLQAALQTVARVGRGVVVYVRGHDGRGIGLLDKLRAYELEDARADPHLGLSADARDYRACAHILADLGVRSVRLLTNNPAKLAALAGYGLSVRDRVPLQIPATTDSVAYLRTKRDRMGHALRLDEMCV
ncbi:bifunctional 3,4-dihydroxy-2-butanone-4-phosphate synthase/GTP cyclohydrolase II [Amycolatopsis jejuensis]|uniref:bifunctional 3,4-dihydroxy-2-butanone-4-phosphate synthase/GTP cyclohydrolase II n=1 Tax=Amycolatopsis jejuensis TaxID=330084 RepID=UPI0005277E9E|nr:bifunctional 3,4-dihydroxy-2-butanone-4-phosphate synthase/GTP cyclohydrolase II [Amycolatopsis jejuensis]